MVNIPIIKFNAGELSSQIDARADVEKYEAGCRHLENFIPRIYGGAEKRPGTKFIYDATNTPTSVANTVVRGIPFIFSTSVAYVVELGNKYARFYYAGDVLGDWEYITWEDESVFYDGAYVRFYEDDWYVDGDTWISTPYLAADLMQLQIKQRADVMWIVHPSYPPSKLSRTGVETFVLEEINFRKGPFLVRNDLADPDDPSSATLACDTLATGSSGTITSSVDLFIPEHVGALFMLIHSRTTTSIEQDGIGTTDELFVKGDYTFNTHGRWTGTVKLQRNENDAGWEDHKTYKAEDDRNIQLSSTESEENVKYRINNVDAADCTAELSMNNVLRKGIVKVTAVVNAYTASITVYSRIESTAATKRWHEGAWSKARGYPGTIAFFNNRCVYAGASRALSDSEYTAAQYPALRI